VVFFDLANKDSNRVSWRKNFGKSVRYSTKGLIKDFVPATVHTADSINTTIRDVRKIGTRYRNVHRQQNVQMNKSVLGRNAKAIFDTAKNDLRTGKFGMRKSIDDLSDELADELDNEVRTTFDPESEEFDNERSQEEIMLSGNEGIARTVAASSSAQMEAMQSVTKEILGSNFNLSKASTESLINSQMYNTNLLNSSLIKMNSTLETINQNISTIIDFQNENVSSTNQAMLDYFERSSDMINQIGEMFATMQDYENGTDRRELRKFDVSKGFNPKEYLGYVKDAFLNSTAISILGMVKSTGGMDENSPSPFKDPVGFITRQVINNAIPRDVKKSLKKFDKAVANSINEALYRISDMDNGIADILNWFGLSEMGNKRNLGRNIISMQNYYKDSMPWNGYAQRALVEVIPEYLSNIDLAVNKLAKLDNRSSMSEEDKRYIDRNKRYYNFDEGKFQNLDAIKEDFHNNIDMTYMGLTDIIEKIQKQYDDEDRKEQVGLNLSNLINDYQGKRLKPKEFKTAMATELKDLKERDEYLWNMYMARIMQELDSSNAEIKDLYQLIATSGSNVYRNLNNTEYREEYTKVNNGYTYDRFDGYTKKEFAKSFLMSIDAKDLIESAINEYNLSPKLLEEADTIAIVTKALKKDMDYDEIDKLIKREDARVKGEDLRENGLKKLKARIFGERVSDKPTLTERVTKGIDTAANQFYKLGYNFKIEETKEEEENDDEDYIDDDTIDEIADDIVEELLDNANSIFNIEDEEEDEEEEPQPKKSKRKSKRQRRKEARKNKRAKRKAEKEARKNKPQIISNLAPKARSNDSDEIAKEAMDLLDEEDADFALNLSDSQMASRENILDRIVRNAGNLPEASSFEESLLNANNMAVLYMVRTTTTLQHLSAKLFGREGILNGFSGDNDGKGKYKNKTDKEIHDFFFDEEEGVFADEKKEAKEEKHKLTEGVKNELVNAYDTAFTNTAKYIFGDDYRENEKFYKYMGFFDIKGKKEEKEARKRVIAKLNGEHTEEEIDALVEEELVRLRNEENINLNNEEETTREIEENEENVDKLEEGKSSFRNKIKSKLNRDKLREFFHREKDEDEEDITDEELDELSRIILEEDEDENTTEEKKSSVINRLKARLDKIDKSKLKSFFHKENEDEEFEESPDEILHDAAEEAAENIVEASEDFKDSLSSAEKEKIAKANNKTFKDKVKATFPKAIAGAILGLLGGAVISASGGSLLASAFLPSGPIGGAIVGSGLAILSQTEAIKSLFFGKKDENGERYGGLISKKLSEKFKKALPVIIGGATLGVIRKLIFPNLGANIGGVGGVITNALLPSGLLGGALLGTSIALVKNSDTIKDILFGKKDKDGKRNSFIAKTFGGTGNLLKKAVPTVGRALTGAGIGALSGAVLSNMGLIPAAFSLGGPVGMGLFGLGVGIASSTKKFNEFLFGSEILDKDGQPTGKKTSGLLTRATNILKVNMIDPVVKAFMNSVQGMVDWTKKAIEYPFRLTFGPIISSIVEIKDNIVEAVKSAIEKIKDGIIAVMRAALTKLFSPFTKILGKIGTFAINSIKASLKLSMMPASIGLKGLQLFTMGKRRRDYMSFYKSYWGNLGSALAAKWDQDYEDDESQSIYKSRGRSLSGKIFDTIQAVTGRGEIGETARSAYNDVLRNNGKNSLGYLDVASEKRQLKKDRKERKQDNKVWNDVDKLRGRIVTELGGREVQLTDKQLADYQKKFEKAGLSTDRIQTSDQLMDLLYRKWEWKKQGEEAENNANLLNILENTGVKTNNDQWKETEEYYKDSKAYLARLADAMEEAALDRVTGLDKYKKEDAKKAKRLLQNRAERYGMIFTDRDYQDALDSGSELGLFDEDFFDEYVRSPEFQLGDFRGFINKKNEPDSEIISKYKSYVDNLHAQNEEYNELHPEGEEEEKENTIPEYKGEGFFSSVFRKRRKPKRIIENATNVKTPYEQALAIMFGNTKDLLNDDLANLVFEKHGGSNGVITGSQINTFWRNNKARGLDASDALKSLLGSDWENKLQNAVYNQKDKLDLTHPIMNSTVDKIVELMEKQLSLTEEGNILSENANKISEESNKISEKIEAHEATQTEIQSESSITDEDVTTRINQSNPDNGRSSTNYRPRWSGPFKQWGFNKVEKYTINEDEDIENRVEAEEKLKAEEEKAAKTEEARKGTRALGEEKKYGEIDTDNLEEEAEKMSSSILSKIFSPIKALLTAPLALAGKVGNSFLTKWFLGKLRKYGLFYGLSAFGIGMAEIIRPGTQDKIMKQTDEIAALIESDAIYEDIVIPKIEAATSGLGRGIEWIGDNFPTIWENTIKPALQKITFARDKLVDVAKIIVTNVMVPMASAAVEVIPYMFKEIGKALWNKSIGSVFSFLHIDSEDDTVVLASYGPDATEEEIAAAEARASKYGAYEHYEDPVTGEVRLITSVDAIGKDVDKIEVTEDGKIKDVKYKNQKGKKKTVGILASRAPIAMARSTIKGKGVVAKLGKAIYKGIGATYGGLAGAATGFVHGGVRAGMASGAAAGSKVGGKVADALTNFYGKGVYGLQNFGKSNLRSQDVESIMNTFFKALDGDSINKLINSTDDEAVNQIRALIQTAATDGPTKVTLKSEELDELTNIAIETMSKSDSELKDIGEKGTRSFAEKATQLAINEEKKFLDESTENIVAEVSKKISKEGLSETVIKSQPEFEQYISTTLAESATKANSELAGEKLVMATRATARAIEKNTEDTVTKDLASKTVTKLATKTTEEMMADANSGILKSIIAKAKSAISSIAKNEKVIKVLQKLLPASSGGTSGIAKVCAELSNLLDDAGKKLLTNSSLTKKILGMISTKAAKGIAGMSPLTVVFTLYNAVSGASAKYTANLFGVSTDDVNAGMRVAGSIVKTIMGLPIVWLLDVAFTIIKFATDGLTDVEQWFAMRIYDIYADDAAMQELEEAQNRIEAEVNAYNATHSDSNISTATYTESINQGWFTKLKNALTGNNKDESYTSFHESYTSSPESYSQYTVSDSTINSTISNTGYGYGNVSTTKLTANDVINDPDINAALDPVVGYGNDTSSNLKTTLSQADPKWRNVTLGTMPNGSKSTMETGGCGPTSLAIVASQLSGQQVDPGQVGQYAVNNGYITDGGANAGLFTTGAASMGLAPVTISDGKTLLKSIASGRPTIIAGNNNNKGDENPYTNAGHIVVANGLDQSGKVVIKDPLDGTITSYGVDKVINNATGSWTYGTVSGYGDPVIDAYYKSINDFDRIQERYDIHNKNVIGYGTSLIPSSSNLTGEEELFLRAYQRYDSTSYNSLLKTAKAKYSNSNKMKHYLINLIKANISSSKAKKKFNAWTKKNKYNINANGKYTENGGSGNGSSLTTVQKQYIAAFKSYSSTKYTEINKTNAKKYSGDKLLKYNIDSILALMNQNQDSIVDKFNEFLYKKGYKINAYCISTDWKSYDTSKWGTFGSADKLISSTGTKSSYSTTTGLLSDSALSKLTTDQIQALIEGFSDYNSDRYSYLYAVGQRLYPLSNYGATTTSLQKDLAEAARERDILKFIYKNWSNTSEYPTDTSLTNLDTYDSDITPDESTTESTGISIEHTEEGVLGYIKDNNEGGYSGFSSLLSVLSSMLTATVQGKDRWSAAADALEDEANSESTDNTETDEDAVSGFSSENTTSTINNQTITIPSDVKISAKQLAKYTKKERVALMSPFAKTLGVAASVPPSLILAQANYESQLGESTIATNSNNLFGMKKGSWKGETYKSSSGKVWRKYSSIGQSMLDYANNLGTSSYYTKVRSAKTSDDAYVAISQSAYLDSSVDDRSAYLSGLRSFVKSYPTALAADSVQGWGDVIGYGLGYGDTSSDGEKTFDGLLEAMRSDEMLAKYPDLKYILGTTDTSSTDDDEASSGSNVASTYSGSGTTAADWVQTSLGNAKISSTFGNRYHPIDKVTKFHKGIDFAAAAGTKIYSPVAGTVTRANGTGANNNGWGNLVVVQDSKGYKHYFAHQSKIAVSSGNKVSKGSLVGYVGTTGKSTGNHLHYGILKPGVSDTSVSSNWLDPNQYSLSSGYGYGVLGYGLGMFDKNISNSDTIFNSNKNNIPTITSNTKFDKINIKPYYGRGTSNIKSIISNTNKSYNNIDSISSSYMNKKYNRDISRGYYGDATAINNFSMSNTGVEDRLDKIGTVISEWFDNSKSSNSNNSNVTNIVNSGNVTNNNGGDTTINNSSVSKSNDKSISNIQNSKLKAIHQIMAAI
jgi:murein DD-endopeptidase MepM/ murein hydrolase activator NlpD